jgi:alpha-1,3-rhamnosyl/mannosyltransferase
VREVEVGAPANSLATLLWPSRLVDLRDVDVLHAPFNLLGRSIRCATVVTVHDLIWLLTPGAAEGVSLATPFQALFYRDGILRALRSATRIVSISRATADAIHLVAPEASSRVRVIPHGVERWFAPPADAEAARAIAARAIGTSDPYLLVVGQNAPFKHHEGILEAFAAAGLGERVRLVLLQRLYAKGKLARRAKDLGIEQRVLWCSGLSAPDMLAVLQSAIALVQFSRFEGFGMPVAEAMACGTPVVASDIAPLVEVAGGAALHASLDPRALATLLRRVVNEPSLRQELSARGIERARSMSWDRSAEAHLDVYREAASAR